MKLHPREAITRAAEVEFQEAVDVITSKHGLTHIEKMQLIHRIADRYVTGYLKYELRYERHGNGDTPGGRAAEEEADHE